MYRFIKYFVGIVCISLLVFSHTIAGEKVWVSSPGANLKADKSASSQTIAELPLGTELTVVSTEDRWYQVTVKSGTQGWIYRGKVSDSPPEQKEGDDKVSVGSAIGDLTGSGIRADASDTSRSIRGLSPEAKEYAKMTGTQEKFQKALDKVLALPTRSADVEKFLKAEKIGEYAQ